MVTVRTRRRVWRSIGFVCLALAWSIATATAAQTEKVTENVRAAQVRLEHKWAADPTEMRVGQQAVRRIDVLITGMIGQSPPKLFMGATRGVVVRLSKPEIETIEDGDETVRRFRFEQRLRVDTPTTVDIRPVYVHWLSTVDGKLKLAALPPLRIAAQVSGRNALVQEFQRSDGWLIAAARLVEPYRWAIVSMAAFVGVVGLSTAGVGRRLWPVMARLRGTRRRRFANSRLRAAAATGDALAFYDTLSWWQNQMRIDGTDPVQLEIQQAVFGPESGNAADFRQYADQLCRRPIGPQTAASRISPNELPVL